MKDPVITRFAPSPTGFLHIGGARTALFNWLFAKRSGGKMLLRIEDTDRARSTKDAIEAIIEGLTWLELDWSDDPIFQSSRAKRHVEIAEKLLKEGKAYRCYASAEELEHMRETARAEGRTAVYDGTWRDKDPSDAPANVDPVIRFRSPDKGDTVIDDQVQGTVSYKNKDLDDLILLRSDGTPTYMLSVVVDDHDMEISHIVRGDDHLTNAARQKQIYEALGWSVPVFAHIPLIHGPDGAKLSKRHGALGVEAYRDMGYLPEAMRNYLVRLGWSHGDDEIFSTEQMIEWFSLDGIGKAPSRFDFQKLENVNRHYIRASDDDALIEQVKDLWGRTNADETKKLTKDREKTLRLALPGLKERAKTLVELIDGAAFLLTKRPLNMNDKALKLLTDESRVMLGQLLPVLEAVEAWSLDAIETAVRHFAEQSSLKFGKIAQPLRAALTGGASSPGIFDVLYSLGREESLARIKDQQSSGESN